MSEHQSDNNKDVIYLDAEEDITGIIAKVRGSSKRIIALVLPKRFATMQSIVNMKLLKRAAERDKKNLVLITAEAGLLPLAAAAGVHVAKTLQSKPEIPDVPEASAIEPDEEVAEAEELPDEDTVDKSKSIGELDGDEDVPIELDNSSPANGGIAGLGKKAGKSKSKKDKKLKIPNFNKFRTWLILGGVGVVLLTGGLIWAFAFAPKADIFINTDSTAVTSSGEITLDSAKGATLNAEEKVVPATAVETKRTRTAEVEATGQKNNGKAATGSVVMTSKNCDTTATPPSVVAGSGVTANGKTYVTQKKADFSFDEFSGGCLTFKTGSIGIDAQNAGSDYNANSATFAVAGRTDVTATGSATGGTDEIIKVVTQSDIDKAKKQIEEQQDQEINKELSAQLKSQNLFVIPNSLTTTNGEASSSAQPDQQADKVTVTQPVTYKMVGVNREDLEKVVAESVADSIDSSRQTILNYGLDEATFTLQNQTGNETLIGLRSVVTAGPNINVDEVKSKVAGLKSSEAKPLLEEYPGVVSVDISYGPFWVKSIPKNTGKINVTIEEPEVVNTSSQEGDNAAEQ